MSRSSFDSASCSQIATFGGVGRISQLLATEAHVFVRRLNQDHATLHHIDPDGGNPTLLLTADINNVRTNGTTSYHVGASALYFRSGASLHTAGLDGSGLVEFVPEADVGGFPSLTRPRRHPCVVVGHGRGRARHLAPDQVARD